jgi:hypothetical protein
MIMGQLGLSGHQNPHQPAFHGWDPKPDMVARCSPVHNPNIYIYFVLRAAVAIMGLMEAAAGQMRSDGVAGRQAGCWRGCWGPE